MSDKKVSNAILYQDELKDHFGETNENGEYLNHYLYQVRDDNTLVCWMCCDFEIVDGNEILLRGSCGDGIVYDLKTKTISIERG